MFIDEQTTADEAPNGVLRFVLALAGADPKILTDGTCVEFLSKFFLDFLFPRPPCMFKTWGRSILPQPLSGLGNTDSEIINRGFGGGGTGDV